MCVVGRYLTEEEIEHERKLHTPGDVHKTITRCMVVISIALSLEGLESVFEAGNENVTDVLFPIAIVICAVFVLLLGGCPRIETLLRKNSFWPFFPNIFVKERNYSPQMFEKTDSKRLSLATASILGQPPRAGYLSALKCGHRNQIE